MTREKLEIVVGFDGSAASRRALEEAALRAGPGGRLFVVHGFRAPGEQYGRPNAGLKLASEHEAARAARAGAEAVLSALPAAPDWEFELLAGPPADAIVRVAAVRDADHIVVGSRGVGRARGLFGSVAHDVLHLADRPVVVIPEKAVERARLAA